MARGRRNRSRRRKAATSSWTFILIMLITVGVWQGCDKQPGMVSTEHDLALRLHGQTRLQQSQEPARHEPGRADTDHKPAHPVCSSIAATNMEQERT